MTGFYFYEQFASLCMVGYSPVLGPEAGGTNVTLKLSGTIDATHDNYSCKFGTTVVYGHSFAYTSDGYPTITCTAPSGSAGTVDLRFSLNGKQYSRCAARWPPLLRRRECARLPTAWEPERWLVEPVCKVEVLLYCLLQYLPAIPPLPAEWNLRTRSSFPCNLHPLQNRSTSRDGLGVWRA